jgi:hypothetical protein
MSEELVSAVEESPVLEAVTGKRLAKTQQTGKLLTCAVVKCGDYQWHYN